MIGHKLLPVYNRGGMLTWLFTKIGKKIEIKMAQNCCEDGSLNFLGVEYKSVQWHYGSSSSAKLRMLLLESERIASYWPQYCFFAICFVLAASTLSSSPE